MLSSSMMIALEAEQALDSSRFWMYNSELGVRVRCCAVAMCNGVCYICALVPMSASG